MNEIKRVIIANQENMMAGLNNVTNIPVERDFNFSMWGKFLRWIIWSDFFGLEKIRWIPKTKKTTELRALDRDIKLFGRMLLIK